MVAIIKFGSSIRRTFHYNENKVVEGKAQLLAVENYPITAEQLTAQHRLNMLLKTAETNSNVRLNSVHISLNFAPGEQLDDTVLKQISAEYLEQIGFGDQPYLLYRHDDAGHPHVHIATVKVRVDGTRIETQNIGKELSDPARRELEKKYGLIRAEDHKRQLFSLKPVDVQRVQYGKLDTRRAIANVLGKVIDSYRYTSIPELNAVLRLYNIEASRGDDGSRTFKNKGLVYRILDSDGRPVGVPIKASLFHNKPTLATLESKFLQHDLARQEHKPKLKSKILYALGGKAPLSPEAFVERLRKEGIHAAMRVNQEGFLYGITYVDHKTRCVFNGSALGKECAAKAVQERLLQGEQQGLSPALKQAGGVASRPADSSASIPDQKLTGSGNTNLNKELANAVEQLLRPEYAAQAVPYEWKKRKKKRRKKL
ncbi:MAG TPA: relaxase/mobilization nuclease domain-containing protein [Pseudosphingobacterium sp.]|nr:relaxase/mobilization nuclease domain-containing protein [Pseudosphingobacterium sp.]